MGSLFLFFNVVLMVFCWNWAKNDFEIGNDKAGWINIFFSALNGAVILNAIWI